MSEKTMEKPKGRLRTARIEIVIGPEIKGEFMELLSEEGKTYQVKLVFGLENI